MRLQDLHTHSLYDDGKASLEEMVRAGIDRGLDAIGLSGHSPIEGEADWTMLPEALPEYLREARRLQAEYRDRITVYCGIEYDMRSRMDLSGFDYVIGSLHSIVTREGVFSVDDTAGIAEAGVKQYFGGNADAGAEAYFAQYRAMAENPEIDIVGHFDLLTKFDERIGLYDPHSRRYRDAAYAAMERLARSGKIFELNSGAISRGYRTSPYPSEALLRHLHSLGGSILLSSDAHSAQGVGYYFREMLKVAEKCGFTEVYQLINGRFTPISIVSIEV